MNTSLWIVAFHLFIHEVCTDYWSDNYHDLVNWKVNRTENLFTFKGDWRERENVHQQADHDGLRSKYFHRPDSHIQPFADIQSHQVDMPLPTLFTFLEGQKVRRFISKDLSKLWQS